MLAPGTDAGWWIPPTTENREWRALRDHASVTVPAAGVRPFASADRRIGEPPGGEELVALRGGLIAPVSSQGAVALERWSTDVAATAAATATFPAAPDMATVASSRATCDSDPAPTTEPGWWIPPNMENREWRGVRRARAITAEGLCMDDASLGWRCCAVVAPLTQLL